MAVIFTYLCPLSVHNKGYLLSAPLSRTIHSESVTGPVYMSVQVTFNEVRTTTVSKTLKVSKTWGGDTFPVTQTWLIQVDFQRNFNNVFLLDTTSNKHTECLRKWKCLFE